MAVVTYRPQEDLVPIQHISLHNGPLFEEIKEVTSDKDSTYIYHNTDDENISTLKSKIVYGITSPLNLSATDRIIRAELVIAAKKEKRQATASINGSIFLNDTEYSGNPQDITGTYKFYKIDFTNQVNNYVQQVGNIFQTIPIQLITSGNAPDADKKNLDYSKIIITQSYFELEYEQNQATDLTFFAKKDGKWVQYNELYEKQNNIWVLTDPNQIFGSFQNQTDTKYVYQEAE